MARKRTKTTRETDTMLSPMLEVGRAAGQAYSDFVQGLMDAGLEPREANSLAVLAFSQMLGKVLSAAFMLIPQDNDHDNDTYNV